MEVGGGEEELRVVGREFCGPRAAVAPFLGPKPVSTTSVAWPPTTIAMLGKPMIANTWSEILVVFSLTIGWLICANAPVAASAASIRSVASDLIVSLLPYAEVGLGIKRCESSEICFFGKTAPSYLKLPQVCALRRNRAPQAVSR
jgi:hypothetical protein